MRRRSSRVAASAALATIGSLALAGAVLADDSPPANLGNGLSRLVQPPGPTAGGFHADQALLAIRDKAGRVLVDVYARPGESLATVRQRAEAAGLQVQTQSTDQQALEGFIALDHVKTLATTDGIASVNQAPKAFTKVGAATSQGVHAQRVDRVPRGIDGNGITVGALSDSFDEATTDVNGNPLTIHAAQDVASGDLPKDVKVVEDSTQGADEGRAMLQIVHDIAPRAKECFATANGGDLHFADNIRTLADRNGPCRANVITDDVGYFDEPFFGESVIGDAINDVTAQGVSYFSSAGNGSSQQAYAAPLRTVAPDKPGDRSNIDLSTVPPELYAGGFHDFDPGDGVDVAQNIAVGAVNGKPGDAILDLQWDDPVDPAGAPLGPSKLSTTGEITAAKPVASIPFQGAAGETINATVDAIPSGSTDLILTLKDAAGNTLQQQDTGTSPETIVQKLPTTGTYTFEVSGFQGDLGDFTFDVRDVLGNSHTTTDLNALFFTQSGRFVGAAADLNQLSGNPFEIFGFQFAGPLQLVIAKANTDQGSATQLRYAMFDGLQNDEYVQPLAPSIFGHPMARGANAVAAYDPFRPLLPEDYTSVGGRLPILFDSAGNRLPAPDIRQKPDLASTDGGNTTFFTTDSQLDPDTQPNFFGTSAAAPHAAGIAALALQAHGGRGSLSPAAMRALLERSTFPHDLDQDHSEASNAGLTITADGAQGTERRNTRPTWTTPGSMADPQFFHVQYSGPGSITSLTFDGAGANPTGLGTGFRSAGIVFDPRPFLGLPVLGAPDLFRSGFPFTVGAASPGIDPSAITAEFAQPAVGQANAQQFQQMTVRFPDGALTGGRGVAFGIDRDEAVTAAGDAEAGNSADALGAGELFPEGIVAGPGLAYRAVTSTGQAISGFLRNRVGSGWTPVDGFGEINAQAATARGDHGH
jgi:Subtilase family